MYRFLRNLWPLLAALSLFTAATVFVQMNMAGFQDTLQNGNAVLGMLLFILLGIVTVTIPFASILPVVPIAVALWGWQTTGVLILVAWIIGSQVLFEIARLFGRPVLKRMVAPEKMRTIERLVRGKGLWQSIVIRFFVHGDLVSYAFGIFTKISAWEFGVITVIGVAPAAFLYAYVGSFPLLWQAAIVGTGLVVYGLYKLGRRWAPSFSDRLHLHEFHA